MQGVEYGSFDDIREVEYAKLTKEGVKLRFTSSDFLIDKNAYGNTQYTFAVSQEGDEKLLSVTSKRLMLHLKEFHPLEGKQFEITRTGRGMEVDYAVKEVTE